MRVSELLISIASWLESSENEALMLSEYDEQCLDIVAKACVSAAEILKLAAEETNQIEPVEESKLTPESLDHLHDIITAFDRSGDPELQKTAETVDELIKVLNNTPIWFQNYKKAEKEQDLIKQNYQDTKEELAKLNKAKESIKAIEASPMFKDYRIMEHALSTRTCPDHSGAQMGRVGENRWQCSLDKKVFDYSNGYKLEQNGDIVPGSSVSAQTPNEYEEPHTLFSTREDRLNNR